MSNAKPPGTRIFYRAGTPVVVLEKAGHKSLSYQNTGELVETHIKGLLAIHKRDGKDSTGLLAKYHGDTLPNSD